MTVLSHEMKTSFAFIERNFYLTRRYWGWELAFLVYSVAGALSISLIGAQAGDPRLLLSLCRSSSRGLPRRSRSSAGKAPSSTR
ncbi:MAG TPA: hypothetical protein VKR24_03395 [Candidatus Limnocylindrales bacterium]|nr:hypothetical protein [Candidatus Limnocylindrales bacterium]